MLLAAADPTGDATLVWRAARVLGHGDAQLFLAERDGQVIRLGQVADIIDGTEEARSLALFSARTGPEAGYTNRESVGIDTVVRQPR